MLDQTLALAIREEVEYTLAAVSDGIARLELGKDWPIEKALIPLADTSAIKIVCARPYRPSDFKKLVVTSDSGAATGWRNDESRAFKILVVGATTGTLDAGLKDLRRVARDGIVSRWKSSVTKHLETCGDLSKNEVQRLIKTLFSEVRSGSLSATAFQEYLEAIEKTPTVSSVNGNLWRLGLMVDTQSTDTGMSAGRIQLNKELVELLTSSEDAKLDKKLATHAGSQDKEMAKVARAALSYRKLRDRTRLAEINLPVLQRILKTPARTATRPIDLFDLLNKCRQHASSVRACLADLGDAWDLDSTDSPQIVEAVVAGRDSLQVRLEVTPQISEQQGALVLSTLWTGTEHSPAVLAFQSESSDPESPSDGQVKFTVDKLRQSPLGNVARYLEARQQLGSFEPWLEKHAYPLLLLKEEAREAVKTFLSAWEALAEEATALDDARETIDMVQVLETVQGVDKNNKEPSWTVIGPLHPFRLDPISKVVDQTLTHLTGDSDVACLGDAIRWTLDRCFPAYPTIHRGHHTFSRTSVRDVIAYSRKPGRYVPPATDHSGLIRVFQAIDGYSPWLSDSISTIVIDPPPGGAVSRALTALSSQRDQRRSHVYHVATANGLDSLDSYDGEVRYLPGGASLGTIASTLPDANVIIRFVGETAGDSAIAGAAWSATRGTHLALELQEGTPSAFSGNTEPSIKIDPRAGNKVVLLSQRLFAKQSGGMPSLAVIRPLLQTDEAPVLSSLAAKTDWLIFAAPGPLGLVSPPTINHTLRFVGRANAGVYGLYVYAADDMFAVRKLFDEYFKNTPVGSQAPSQSIEILVKKAQQSAQAILFASRGQIHAQVGALVALDIAQKGQDGSATTLVLSLDDFGWTRAWLADSNDRRRADFLIVFINTDGSIVFRIVESKTDDSGVQVPLEVTQTAYKQALEQAAVSSRALKDITCAATPTLDQDLRFASLIEHLMAAALSHLAGKSDSVRKKVFGAVNQLSKREIVPKFESMVILTQSKVNALQRSKTVDSETVMIWAGAGATEHAFGVADTNAAASAAKPKSSESPLANGPVVRITPVETVQNYERAMPVSEEASPEMHSETNLNDAVMSASELPTSDGHVLTEEFDIARSFLSAAKTHGIPVSDGEPVYLKSGPTLFAFGMRLHSGTSASPLKNRLQDIARDIGIGDRADLIELDNDSEARTVRILLPRTSRSFPRLPREGRVAVDKSGVYLPLDIGQSVDGSPYVSAVEAWPHLLIAGTSGSGKTEFLKTLLKQVCGFGSSLARLIVVDGKGDTDYLGLIPRAMFVDDYPEIQTGHQTAIETLTWVEAEMERRRALIVETARRNPRPEGTKGPDIFKLALAEKRDPEVVPLIVVIDEFADIMLASKKKAEEFENLVQRISQVGRSRLIHLVLATQRPDKETIRGSIKANLNARAVFRLPTAADSMTVLGHAGAERLLMKGDMLFQYGTGRPVRLQGYKI